MSDIKFIEGGIFTDYRGQISHVNDLDMQEIKRFYIIHQKDTSIIRAWHARKEMVLCCQGIVYYCFCKNRQLGKSVPQAGTGNFSINGSRK